MTNLISSLIVCGIYYYVWAKWIPKWRGYQLRQEVVNLGGGAEAHLIAKIPVGEVEAWDANHDAAGRVRNTVVTDLGDEKAVRASSEADSKNASAVQTLYV